MDNERELREVINQLDSDLLLEFDVSNIKSFALKAAQLFGKDSVPSAVAFILYGLLKHFYSQVKYINTSVPDDKLSTKLNRFLGTSLHVRLVEEIPASGVTSFKKVVYVKRSIVEQLTDRELLAYITVNIRTGNLGTIGAMFYKIHLVAFIGKLMEFISTKLQITSRNYLYQSLYIALQMFMTETIFVLSHSVISKQMRIAAMNETIKKYNLKKDLISAYKKMLGDRSRNVQVTKLGKFILNAERLLERYPTVAEKLDALVDDPEKAEAITRSLTR